MSGTSVAVRKSAENGFKIDTFVQKIPIPSYLVAIVAGQLDRK